MTLRRKRKSVDPDKIYLGKISRPHALFGEVKLIPFGCDVVLLDHLETVYVDDREEPLTIEAIRGSDKTPIVKFKGVDNRNDSEALQGALIWTRREALPDLEDEFVYASDFLGAQALDSSGEDLGRVDDIIETGARDVLVIRKPGCDELLVPAIDEFIKEIRRDDNIIVVDPPRYED